MPLSDYPSRTPARSSGSRIVPPFRLAPEPQSKKVARPSESGPPPPVILPRPFVSMSPARPSGWNGGRTSSTGVGGGIPAVVDGGMYNTINFANTFDGGSPSTIDFGPTIDGGTL